METTWILTGIFILLAALAIVSVMMLRKNKFKQTIDYKKYFHIGIIWLLFGIISSLIFESSIGCLFIIMGIAYLAAGLLNRKKWGKPQKINPKTQKLLIIAVFIAVILLGAGIAVFELLNSTR